MARGSMTGMSILPLSPGVGKAREDNGKISTGRSGPLVRWMYQTEQERTGRLSGQAQEYREDTTCCQ